MESALVYLLDLKEFESTLERLEELKSFVKLELC